MCNSILRISIISDGPTDSPTTESSTSTESGACFGTAPTIAPTFLAEKEPKAASGIMCFYSLVFNIETMEIHGTVTQSKTNTKDIIVESEM